MRQLKIEKGGTRVILMTYEVSFIGDRASCFSSAVMFGDDIINAS